MQKVKAKDLTVGMNVIITKSHKRCHLADQTGTPLTVKAVEYPFVTFEWEAEEINMPVLSLFGSGGPQSRFKQEVIRHTANVKGSKFRLVSDEYVRANRRLGSEFETLVE